MMSGIGLASGVMQIAGSLLDYGLQNNAIRQQNEYNAPVSQLKRLNDAGLNPNLIYGSIQPSTQTNIPSSKLDPSVLATNIIKSKELQLAEELNNSQVKVNQAQEENIRQDTENKKAQNPLIQENARQLKSANDMQDIFNEYKREHPESTYIPELEQFNNQLEHIRNMDDISAQNLALNKLMNSAQTKKLAAETKFIDKQKDKVEKEIELLDKDIQYYVERYLTTPYPWYADLILSIVQRAAGLKGNSPKEIIDSAVDKVVEDGKVTKEAATKKINVIYNSRYVKHDGTYTYRKFTSGQYKGKYARVRQSDGSTEILDYLP